jgi:hypothetical protein
VVDEAVHFTSQGAKTGGREVMRIVKFIGALIGLLIAAAVLIPLVVLAGLFVWLKLTEEADEEALELEQEAAV